jgi:hypothetical protein
MPKVSIDNTVLHLMCDCGEIVDVPIAISIDITPTEIGHRLGLRFGEIDIEGAAAKHELDSHIHELLGG